ncbi:hypothetical protein [uncultured Rossellomorea sp.]|nr:hypothetical protein [uncultured Rossellomorea sp.]
MIETKMYGFNIGRDSSTVNAFIISYLRYIVGEVIMYVTLKLILKVTDS